MTSKRLRGTDGRFKKVLKSSTPKYETSILTCAFFLVLPPLERLKVITNLLQTGVVRSSWGARKLLLQDVSALPPIIQQPPYESMNKPQSSFSTLSVPVLRASLKTWFYPNERS